MIRTSILALACAVGTVAEAQAIAQDTVLELPEAREAIAATGFTGAILVYDQQGDRYLAGHPERIDRRLLPASTFKILNSLISLETGVVANPEAIIKWDGVTHRRKQLNRDLDLTTAFRISALPHYQELARRVGTDRMQRFIDAVGYGNRDTSGGIDNFWLTGGLRVSPRDQVDLLRRLHRDDLPFSVETMAAVREMMVSEQGPGHVIRAKTGWAQPPGGENVGWWIGWVEQGTRVHFFATVLETDTPGKTFGEARKQATRKVLRALGAIE